MEKEQTVVFNNFQILYDYYDLNKEKKQTLTTRFLGGGGEEEPHPYTHKNSNPIYMLHINTPVNVSLTRAQRVFCVNREVCLHG